MSLRDQEPSAPMSLRDHMPWRRFRSATKLHDAIIQSRSDVGREPGTSVPGNVHHPVGESRSDDGCEPGTSVPGNGHHPVGESRSDDGRAASIIIAGFPLTPIVAPRLAWPQRTPPRACARGYRPRSLRDQELWRQRRSATKNHSADVVARPHAMAPISLRGKIP